MDADSQPDSTVAVEPEAPAAVSEVPVDPAVRLTDAHAVVNRNIYWAMGAGVLPFPIIDAVAITGVQIKMLRELSVLYGKPFSEGVAKKAVASLIASIGGVGIGSIVGASLIKLIPVAGQSLGAVSVPVISGMLTHAVGRTFVIHFESGGTVLDFDARSMREYFKKEYSSAKDVVTEMKNDAEPAPSRPLCMRLPTRVVEVGSDPISRGLVGGNP